MIPVVVLFVKFLHHIAEGLMLASWRRRLAKEAKRAWLALFRQILEQKSFYLTF